MSLYSPTAFEADTASGLTLIEEHSFGILIVPHIDASQPPMVAHLPFILDRPGRRLLCHVARANPIWQRCVTGNVVALAVFRGPHAYISPRWYTAPQKSVPTWNYTAVHVTGMPTIVSDDELAAIVTKLSSHHESTVSLVPTAHDTPLKTVAGPWTPAAMPPSLLATMLHAIVGLALPLTAVETKHKLSQNRSRSDQRSVAAALAQQANADARGTAALMARL
jgi:transcriptional regulator